MQFYAQWLQADYSWGGIAGLCWIPYTLRPVGQVDSDLVEQEAFLQMQCPALLSMGKLAPFFPLHHEVQAKPVLFCIEYRLHWVFDDVIHLTNCLHVIINGFVDAIYWYNKNFLMICIRKKIKGILWIYACSKIQFNQDISIVENLYVIIWRLALLLYADQWQSGYHTKFAWLNWCWFRLQTENINYWKPQIDSKKWIES